MTTRTRNAALGLWLLTIALAAALLVAVAAIVRIGEGDEDFTLLFMLVLSAIALSFSTTGAIVAVRLPGNRMGWLLLGVGLAFVLTFSGFAFGAILTLFRGPDDLAAGLLSWLGSAAFFPTFGLLVFIPLLFPDGNLPSRRWRLPVAAFVGALLIVELFTAFRPGLVDAELARNPFGVAALAGLTSLRPLIDQLGYIAVAGGILLGVLAAALRFRRARGAVRLQHKWFLAAIAIVATIVPLSFLFIGEGSDTTPIDFVALGSLALLPVAIGIAILRYRLYEIDRIVSRTIGYGVVTALLVGLFAVLVVGLQAVLQPVTGRDTIPVALSTLGVAALFQPLRSRVQAIVDRRFNRARADAERTVASFAERLRDEVDLASLTADLDSTVRRTLAPSDLRVWLRGPG